MHLRPVRVLVDASAPECIHQTVATAVRWWAKQGLAVELETLQPAQPTSDGDVLVFAGPPPDDSLLGATVPLVAPKQGILSAAVALFVCDAQVAAHELGHAIGLQHSPRPGDLMFPYRKRGGWKLSPDDRAILRDVSRGL